MNNLPQLSAAPQPASNAASKPAAPASPAPTNASNTSAANDNDTQAQSFGDVLARQVAEASSDEDTTVKKTSETAGKEIDAQLQADAAVPVAVAAETSTTLPNDMLAALLPQQTQQPTEVKLEEVAPRSATVTGLPANAPKTTPLPSLNAPSDLAAKTARPGSTPVAVESPKAEGFNTMLETLSAASASKLATDEQPIETLTAPTPAPTPAVATAPQTTAAANVMPAQVNINTPVGRDDWDEEFSQKITWLASTKEQSAELHLNPPQLGPMDVVLKVSGDQATALFSSPHAAVREAIEQALPKLREMMADNGIMLGNATVNDQSPRQHHASANGRSGGGRSVGGVSEATSPTTVRVSTMHRHNGIVDTFA